MKHIIYLLPIILFYNCSFSHKVKDTITKMEEHPVVLNLDKMQCWVGDTTIAEKTWEKEAKLKLIVFSDSSQCSLCYIQGLSLWKDFTDWEEIYKGFSIFFIIEASPGSTKFLTEELKKPTLNHPMYLDEHHTFLKDNPHIPHEPVYHIFLLDEDNHIIMVGSPLHNKSIERLLLKIIRTKLRTEDASDQHENVI